MNAGLLLAAAAAAAFGAIPLLYRIAGSAGADEWTILALRFDLAALAMAAFAAWKGSTWPRGRTLAGLAALGAAGYVGHSLTYMLALRRAPTGLVALLFFLYPVLVVVLCAASGRERPTAARWTAVLSGVGGCALVVGRPESAPVAGVVLALGCAAIYAVYLLACDWAARRSDPYAGTAVVLASCGAVYTAVAAGRGLRLPAAPAGWAAIAAAGLACSALAIGMLFAGLRRAGPSRAAIAGTAEPVVAVALGAAFLGERMAAAQLVGGALVVGSVFLLAREKG